MAYGLKVGLRVKAVRVNPHHVPSLHFDSTSHADFGAATHGGVGGGTHRRRATVERC